MRSKAGRIGIVGIVRIIRSCQGWLPTSRGGQARGLIRIARVLRIACSRRPPRFAVIAAFPAVAVHVIVQPLRQAAQAALGVAFMTANGHPKVRFIPDFVAAQAGAKLVSVPKAKAEDSPQYGTNHSRVPALELNRLAALALYANPIFSGQTHRRIHTIII